MNIDLNHGVLVLSTIALLWIFQSGKGRMVRIDSTVTETHISPPSDSNLLWDCARVMVHLR